jgi:hypothetical protein
MFTVHCSLFTVHCSLFTVHCSLFTVHCSLFTVQCSMFNVQCSMFLHAPRLRQRHLAPRQSRLHHSPRAWLGVRHTQHRWHRAGHTRAALGMRRRDLRCGVFLGHHSSRAAILRCRGRVGCLGHPHPSFHPLHSAPSLPLLTVSASSPSPPGRCPLSSQAARAHAQW